MNQCDQARQEYGNLQTLQQEFSIEYDKIPKSAENLEKALKLKAELEQRLASLQKKVWSFESLPLKELKKQYNFQREVFSKVGILETLSNGELGIQAINNKEYSFPALREVIRAMRAEKELFKTKTEQGLTLPLISSFGLSLDKLAQIYGRLIIQHFKEGRLFDSEGNPITDLRRQGEGDDPINDAVGDSEYYPLWKLDRYTEADKNGNLIYFPKHFKSPNHQGKTKFQILEDQGGFLVSFIENEPNIPKATTDPIEIAKRTRKGRRPMEASRTPDQYLETLKTDPQYKGETGMTPEEQLIYAILHLEKTNQVVDDWEGKGSISWQLGAYFPASTASGGIPRASWDRGLRQAYLDGHVPGYFSSVFGARSAVRVKLRT